MLWIDCLRISEKRTAEVCRGSIPRKFCVCMVTDRIWQEHLLPKFSHSWSSKRNVVAHSAQTGNTLLQDKIKEFVVFVSLASDLHGPFKRAKTVLSLLPVPVNHKTSPYLLDSTINTLFELSYSGWNCRTEVKRCRTRCWNAAICKIRDSWQVCLLLLAMTTCFMSNQICRVSGGLWFLFDW